MPWIAVHRRIGIACGESPGIFNRIAGRTAVHVGVIQGAMIAVRD